MDIYVLDPGIEQTDCPRVYVSFSEEAKDPKREVYTFANWLSTNGCLVKFAPVCQREIDVVGRENWIERELHSADFVVLICSEDLFVKSCGSAGGSLAYELSTLKHLLSERQDYSKVIPVLLGKTPFTFVPNFARVSTRYRFPRQGPELLFHLYRQEPLCLKV